jgi:hypothetical protein
MFGGLNPLLKKVTKTLLFGFAWSAKNEFAKFTNKGLADVEPVAVLPCVW